MEEKEDLNGFLLQNSLKIFFMLCIICFFISFCITDSKDILGIRENRKIETSFSIDDLEFVKDVNLCETIFFSFIQLLVIIEFVMSFKKDDILKRILSIKYLFLFMILHISYFFIACLIL